MVKLTSMRPTIGASVSGDTCHTRLDRKSTRLNSSHQIISYAVFCLKKKKIQTPSPQNNTVYTQFFRARKQDAPGLILRMYKAKWPGQGGLRAWLERIPRSARQICIR